MWIGTASQLAVRVVSVFAGLASLTLLTRHLGVHGYGVFATATTFVTLVALITDAGLPLLTAKDLSSEQIDADAYLRTQVRGRLWLSAGAAAVSAGLAVILFGSQPGVTAAILVCLPSLPLLAVTTTLAAALQARLLIHRVAIVGGISRLIALLGVSLAVLADGGLGWCLVATLFGWLAQTVLLWRMVQRVVPTSVDAERADDGFGQMLKRAAPLGVATLVNGVYFRIDGVMVALLAGLTAAGEYAVAYRFLDSLLLVPGAFAAAALPVLARRAAQGNEVLVRAGDLCLRAVVVGVTPVVVAGFVLAPQLVRMIGGAGYDSSAVVLRVLLVGGWFSSVDIVLGLLIIVSGLQGRMLWLNLSALAVNVAGNLFLIPRFGSLGAAIMTAACEAAVLVVAAISLRAYLGLRLRGQLWVPIVAAQAALVVAAVALGLTLTAFAAATIALLIYLGALLATGALAGILRSPMVGELREPALS